MEKGEKTRKKSDFTDCALAQESVKLKEMKEKKSEKVRYFHYFTQFLYQIWSF